MQQKKSPVAKNIQYAPLTDHVSLADIRQYIAENDLKGVYTSLFWIGTVIAVVFGFLAFMQIGYFIAEQERVQVVLFAIFATIAVIAAFGVYYREYIERKATRISKFAHANGWYFRKLVTNPFHTGMIFQYGHTRRASNIVYYSADASTMNFEYGEYQFTVGSGKNQHTEHWFYVCVELDRRLPHMVLDATANNAKLFGKTIVSNLPSVYKKDQVLSLEGDFNKYFTLYAPKEYERDALYVFAPDLMALMIDESSQFDAEIIDNKLYFYVKGYTKIADPSFVYRVLRLINAVGMKMHTQTDYYADERVGDRSMNVVANQGQRLKHGVSVFSIVIGFVAIVYIIASNVLPFILR